jgi:hypothetical protein
MPGIFDLPAAGQAPTATQAARGQVLYDPSNAAFALQNAMLAQGRNPFSSTLSNQFWQRMAGGLGAAFNINQAMTPGLGPNAAGLEQPGAFQQFLESVLQQGNAPAALQGASQAITGGNVSNLINQQQADIAGGGSLVNANPFITILEQMLGSGGGKGATDVLQVLNSPFMGRSGASAYQQNLGNSLATSLRNQVNDPAFDTPNERNGFLEFLLGVPNQTPAFPMPGQMPGGPGATPPQQAMMPNPNQGIPMPDPTRSMFGPFDPPGYRNLNRNQPVAGRGFMGG